MNGKMQSSATIIRMNFFPKWKSFLYTSNKKELIMYILFKNVFIFCVSNLLSFWGATDFLFERSSYLINHMTRREKEGSYRVGRWSFSLDTELLRKFWVASSPIAIRCTWYMNACKMIHFVSPCCLKNFRGTFPS